MSATTATRRAGVLPLPDASMLPPELVASPTWAAWKFIERDGQPVKFPIDANPGPNRGKGAKANDDATWATFEVAYRYARQHGYGLWFFLAEPFVGFDADDCRDRDSEELTPIAASIFGEIDTYAEVSISGTGIKAIGYGRKPGTRCRRNGLKLEIYDRLRGFALTGHRLPDAPLAITDCQAALDHIYSAAFGPLEEDEPRRHGPAIVTDDDDATVIDWLHGYRHGAKFAALWRGDTGAHHGDESAADLALASILAWRVGNDPARIYRLVEASGLHRPKWERQDYRDRTIRKAIEGCRGFYTPAPTPRPQAAPPPPAATVEGDTPAEGESPRVAELVQRVNVLEREVERERGLRLQAQKMLAGFIAIRGNKHIKAERDTIAAAIVEVKAEIADGRADDDGYVKQHTQRIAEKVGKSVQVTRDHLKLAVDSGLFERKPVEEYDPETHQRRTFYKLRPTDEPENLLERLAVLKPLRIDQRTGEEKKEWGGKRDACPACSSRNTHRETRIVCDDCGHVSEPIEVTKTPTNEEIAEALRAEHLPDEPRADAASVPPTTIAVGQAATYVADGETTYPSGSVTYERATLADDEPDDWIPGVCHHRDHTGQQCTRHALPDRRWCDWHSPERAAKLAERQGRNAPTFTVEDTGAGWDRPAPVLPAEPPCTTVYDVQPIDWGAVPLGTERRAGVACAICGEWAYEQPGRPILCPTHIGMKAAEDGLVGGDVAAGGGD